MNKTSKTFTVSVVGAICFSVMTIALTKVFDTEGIAWLTAAAASAVGLVA